jgi:DNA-binding Lrp family transcriptional regulator
MDALDRCIVNRLQDGLPICARPYAKVARELGIGEDDLLTRLNNLLDDGTLSRFGPMFDAGRLGGAYSLCALRVPTGQLDRVADLVNRHPEVAHNYQREHEFNLWFVLAAIDAARLALVIKTIEGETGLRVHDFPKLHEFHVGLRFET